MSMVWMEESLSDGRGKCEKEIAKQNERSYGVQMSLLSTSKEEIEELRGLADHKVLTLSNEQLIMLALGILFGAEGVEDDVVRQELLRRGKE